MGGGGSKVTLVFCFRPKPKFCSFDLDLDQAEQKCRVMNVWLDRYIGLPTYLADTDNDIYRQTGYRYWHIGIGIGYRLVRYRL